MRNTFFFSPLLCTSTTSRPPEMGTLPPLPPFFPFYNRVGAGWPKTHPFLLLLGHVEFSRDNALFFFFFFFFFQKERSCLFFFFFRGHGSAGELALPPFFLFLPFAGARPTLVGAPPFPRFFLPPPLDTGSICGHANFRFLGCCFRGVPFFSPFPSEKVRDVPFLFSPGDGRPFFSPTFRKWDAVFFFPVGGTSPLDEKIPFSPLFSFFFLLTCATAGSWGTELFQKVQLPPPRGGWGVLWGVGAGGWGAVGTFALTAVSLFSCRTAPPPRPSRREGRVPFFVFPRNTRAVFSAGLPGPFNN